MSSSRTRSSTFTASQSAPSSSSIRDVSERRSSSKGKRAKDLTCETCGKHPVCLQKHRWEHTPQWRDTAQLLLSKHQQVQLMEAAAILVYGSSLPQDRSLWPVYMAGGTLPNQDGDDADRGHRSRSRSLSTSAREEPRSSQFDDDELEEVSEIDEDQAVQEVDDEAEEMEEDETDESDMPTAAIDYGRARSRSVGLASSVQSHLHGPTVVGSRMLPTSLAPTSYGWGVITESGQYGSYQGSVGNKSPLSDMHPSPRSPMAIPTGNADSAFQTHTSMRPTHKHHQSMSSFGSFTHSLGSSSLSSYIPSSSVRSELDEMHRNVEAEEEMYDYNQSRASSLYKRLSSTVNNGHHHHRSVSSTSGYYAANSAAGKTPSPDRRRDEGIYEMEMD
ncbi:hypothetical protein FRB91_011410 [Serendipita sp. 411]|nr:hypothetical protein FRC16_006006 [Serendipita sp. 398]KAG8857394.1 hypothetical protein FRB91_011410 [Serendipita sp. 411]